MLFTAFLKSPVVLNRFRLATPFWKTLTICFRDLLEILPFYKMAETFNMTANFLLSINRSIFNQFEYVNVFWKRLLIESIKNMIFRNGGNFKTVTIIFQLAEILSICYRFRHINAFWKRLQNDELQLSWKIFFLIYSIKRQCQDVSKMH
jgi:hypothetical protein